MATARCPSPAADETQFIPDGWLPVQGTCMLGVTVQVRRITVRLAVEATPTVRFPISPLARAPKSRGAAPLQPDGFVGGGASGYGRIVQGAGRGLGFGMLGQWHDRLNDLMRSRPMCAPHSGPRRINTHSP